MTRLAVRALPALALMGVIFWFSAKPPSGTDIPEWGRVVAHFSEYALLAWLWAWALHPELGKKAIAVSAAVCVVYAISDEFHQSFVDGRDSDLKDVMVDCIGITASLVLFQARGRASTRRTQSRSSG